MQGDIAQHKVRNLERGDRSLAGARGAGLVGPGRGGALYGDHGGVVFQVCADVVQQVSVEVVEEGVGVVAATSPTVQGPLNDAVIAGAATSSGPRWMLGGARMSITDTATIHATGMATSAWLARSGRRSPLDRCAMTPLYAALSRLAERRRAVWSPAADPRGPTCSRPHPHRQPAPCPQGPADPADRLPARACPRQPHARGRHPSSSWMSCLMSETAPRTWETFIEGDPVATSVRDSPTHAGDKPGHGAERRRGPRQPHGRGRRWAIGAATATDYEAAPRVGDVPGGPRSGAGGRSQPHARGRQVARR